MARQTEVVLLLILAMAATVFATVVKPQSDADFDKIVKEAKESQEKSKSLICPFGWLQLEGKCYLYQASNVDWASAENHCQSLDAHMISVHNEHEYQLVKALIRFHDPQERSTWLGLSACQKRNTWFWSDGTKFTFARWNPTEPNFKKGECCALFNDGGQKNWIDAPCEWKIPYVCVRK